MEDPGLERKESLEHKAGRYCRIRYSLCIAETAYLILLLFFSLHFRLAQGLASSLVKLKMHSLFLLPLYLGIVFCVYYILNFSFVFYRSFLLEHQFGLSRQTLAGWSFDQLKSGILSYILAVTVLGSFYFILARYPDHWWWIFSLFWVFLALVLARLMPVLILPLFFRYKRFSDQALKERILGLAEKMRIKVLDVFEIDLSKKTAKANAGLLGWGSTRRVVLSDTLREKYSPDEILVILAHEFSHYKAQHLLKLTALSAANSIACFYLIFSSAGYALSAFGISSLKDLAGLPLVFLYLAVFGIAARPLENFVSRNCERKADRLALESTGLKEAFISTMEKLSRQNLSCRLAHPLIKFFFFDHPPIDERIAAARAG